MVNCCDLITGFSRDCVLPVIEDTVRVAVAGGLTAYGLALTGAVNSGTIPAMANRLLNATVTQGYIPQDSLLSAYLLAPLVVTTLVHAGPTILSGAASPFIKMAQGVAACGRRIAQWCQRPAAAAAAPAAAAPAAAAPAAAAPAAAAPAAAAPAAAAPAAPAAGGVRQRMGDALEWAKSNPRSAFGLGAAASFGAAVLWPSLLTTGLTALSGAAAVATSDTEVRPPVEGPDQRFVTQLIRRHGRFNPSEAATLQLDKEAIKLTAPDLLYTVRGLEVPYINCATALQALGVSEVLNRIDPAIERFAEATLFPQGVEYVYEQNPGLSLAQRDALLAIGKIFRTRGAKLDVQKLLELKNALIALKAEEIPNGILPQNLKEINHLLVLLTMRECYNGGGHVIANDPIKALYKALRAYDGGEFPEKMETCSPSKIMARLTELMEEKPLDENSHAIQWRAPYKDQKLAFKKEPTVIMIERSVGDGEDAFEFTDQMDVQVQGDWFKTGYRLARLIHYTPANEQDPAGADSSSAHAQKGARVGNRWDKWDGDRLVTDLNVAKPDLNSGNSFLAVYVKR